MYKNINTNNSGCTQNAEQSTYTKEDFRTVMSPLRIPFLVACFLLGDTRTSAEAFAFLPLKSGPTLLPSPFSSPSMSPIRRFQRDTSTKPLPLVIAAFPSKHKGGSFCRSSALSTALVDELRYSSDAFSVPLLLVFALGVGFAAQTFINQMLEGEDGLGAFLSDGSGYNKSGFRKKMKEKDTIKTDPLPWLKLPELDFVEVAGQSKIMSEEELMMTLERLREGMKMAVDEGRIKEAESIRKELEQTMEAYGVEFTSNES